MMLYLVLMKKCREIILFALASLALAVIAPYFGLLEVEIQLSDVANGPHFTQAYKDVKRDPELYQQRRPFGHERRWRTGV